MPTISLQKTTKICKKKYVDKKMLFGHEIDGNSIGS